MTRALAGVSVLVCANAGRREAEVVFCEHLAHRVAAHEVELVRASRRLLEVVRSQTTASCKKQWSSFNCALFLIHKFPVELTNF